MSFRTGPLSTAPEGLNSMVFGLLGLVVKGRGVPGNRPLTPDCLWALRSLTPSCPSGNTIAASPKIEISQVVVREKGAAGSCSYKRIGWGKCHLLTGKTLTSYHYENAGFERFQLFCQTLLLDEYPGLQCYPVGQPDGGRDGWHPGTETVLQVKFKKKDEDPEVNADWMIGALEGEKDKIQKLYDAGAKSYVMVTNASGTAHWQVGRMDRVQAWMDANLPLPAQCLWRDDLDGRFVKAPSSLKFAYAELLTGADGIQLAIEGLMGPQRERQMRAIRAFVADQYDDDELVKFKQVELKNSLLDLFIDVPVVLSAESLNHIKSRNPDAREELSEGLRKLSADLHSVDERYRLHRQKGVGAAQLLLSDVGQKNLRLTVLQGAPGQGKSTLAQYVCQVHRARYLQKEEFLGGLTEKAAGAFRLPFKVDLRDLDAFLSGRSPFASSEFVSANPSLEQFLAALVHDGAGGLKFSVDDLVDIFTRMPTLLFLDGLDEVAEASNRVRLVETTASTLRRLEEMGANVQVVITSRPSLFGESPDFERSGFQTLKLMDIGPGLVLSYADKWVVARDLITSDAEEVKRILKDKMDLGHIRELTRNPMQLAILLTLIHQVGYSLPDARTDLYTQYIDRFLIREADKTPEVRQHRPELIEFIQYLAWKLQLDAESSKSSGSISENDLKLELTTFLAQHGNESTSIVEDLFSRGVERITVLVSRITGQYEFEVQPLREYFCARYLYETAPVGTYRRQSPMGDRAQRFEAMAQNPFWMNVTRFYAGSYDRGELADLVSSLKQLIRDTETNHPKAIHARKVGIALLQDWVFRARRAVQDELIDVVFDDVGMAVAAINFPVGGQSLELDVECGRSHLAEKLLKKVLSVDLSYRPYEICNLLRANGGEEFEDAFRRALDGLSGGDRTEMLCRMIISGGLLKADAQKAWDLITVDAPNEWELSKRCLDLHTHRTDWLEEVLQAKVCVVENALRGRSKAVPALDRIGGFVQLHSADRDDFHARHLIHYASREKFWPLTSNFAEEDAYGPSIVTFMDEVASFSDLEMGRDFEWSTSVIDASIAAFGLSWSTYILAARAAGMVTSNRGTGARDLFDSSTPLWSRARYARINGKSATYWQAQLRQAQGPEELMFWVMMVILYSPLNVLSGLVVDLDATVEGFTLDEFERLHFGLSKVVFFTKMPKNRVVAGRDVALFNSNARTFVLLAQTGVIPEGHQVLIRRAKELPQLERIVQSYKRRERLAKLSDLDLSIRAAQEEWLKSAAIGRVSDYSAPTLAFDHSSALKLPSELMTRVLQSYEKYPDSVAENALRTLQIRLKPLRVGRVAEQEKWVFN